MTPSQFRRTVKQLYPHVTLAIRTVHFQDLARASAKVLTITGDRTQTEVATINQIARLAGILPDRSVRIQET